MSVEDAAGYVAAAYGAILVGLIVMYALAARRMTAVARQVRALRESVETRRAAPPSPPSSTPPSIADPASPASAPPPAADPASPPGRDG